MKTKNLGWIACIIGLSFNLVTFAQTGVTKNTGQAMDREPVVLFVCEHGSAKSTVAAAYFNRLAKERGVKLRAISRGTNPDPEVAPKALKGLEADGLASGAAKPQLLSAADTAGAVRVVTFCELPKDFKTSAPVERWDDIPPVSEDYGRSRAAIVERIKRLLEELKPVQVSGKD